ncbi:MAG TPA: helix-turn-helix transcriptional regulator [Jiangellaceae bacterium]
MNRLEPSEAGRSRRDLASALKDLRVATGLSGERLARRCGMSQSKVSRIETGRVLPSVVDVQQILNALAIDGDVQDELLKMVRVANAAYEDVRASVRRGLHHRQRELASLEAAATHVRHFLPSLVTGLLQVPEYMTAALASTVRPLNGDLSKVTSLKLMRQAVLHEEGKRFDFLITENAARWRRCSPSVMALQLDRIISVSRLPAVTVGVLPLDAQVSEGAFHTFVVYDAKLVTAELFSGQVVLRDPKDIDYYTELFAFFQARALVGDDAREQLNTWASDFRSEL